MSEQLYVVCAWHVSDNPYYYFNDGESGAWLHGLRAGSATHMSKNDAQKIIDVKQPLIHSRKIVMLPIVNGDIVFPSEILKNE